MRALLGVLISVVATLAILEFTTTEFTWKAVAAARLPFLFLAFLMQVIFWLLWALRIVVIARGIGRSLPFAYAFQVTMASMFTAAITPSSAGGEPVRVKMLSDAGISAGEATFIVVTERLLDAVFFATALPIFVIATGFSSSLGLKVAAIFASFLAAFIYILYAIVKDERSIAKFSKLLGRLTSKFGRNVESRVSEELRNFRSSALQVIRNTRNLLQLVAITISMWSAGFMIPSLILLAFNSEPQFLYSYAAQLMIVVISLVPLTPGSSGIAEVSMAYLYSKFVPNNLLGVLVAIWRVITYHANILVGALFINFRLVRPEALTPR
ncbi:MAG: UPF0104 family protein [Archaeoglobaceae archaeon]